jgi:hypothetical protein
MLAAGIICNNCFTFRLRCSLLALTFVFVFCGLSLHLFPRNIMQIHVLALPFTLGPWVILHAQIQDKKKKKHICVVCQQVRALNKPHNYFLMCTSSNYTFIKPSFLLGPPLYSFKFLNMSSSSSWWVQDSGWMHAPGAMPASLCLREMCVGARGSYLPSLRRSRKLLLL